MTAPADGATLGDSTVRLGDVLAGKYRVERVLGVGGMGMVVAARHTTLDERVALKLMRPLALKVPGARDRFLREARASAKIKNEHVARVLDVGELEDGSPYMVMEYLEGRDLAAWLEHRGALPIEQAVDFVIQASEAIAEAHVLGIVHRDLKPANLLAVHGSDGELIIKVLDFGISKFLHPGGPGDGMTKTNELIGSPFYMSPEQMQHAKGVDARSDIWSIGVILYQLITGRTPFLAESVMDLAIKVAIEPTPPMRAIRPDVPAPLEAVVLTCLEKDRRRRYENVAELAVALAPFASPRSRASVDKIQGITRTGGIAHPMEIPPMDQSPAGLMGPEGLQGTIEPLGQTTRRDVPARAPLNVAVGIALAGVLVVVGAVLMHRSPAQPAELSWSAAPPVADAESPSPSATDSGGTGSAAETTTPPASASTPPPRATSRAAQPSRRPTYPAASPDCDPPYTIDDLGRKHFKHECYTRP